MRVLDLFAGAGGMSLGMNNAGHTIVHSYDNWNAAIDTVRANFDHPATLVDLSDMSAWDEVLSHDYDVITAGPPCQDFSIAGARQTDGVRANLTLTFARLIERAKPSCFVMENVNSILGTNVLEESKDIFMKAGYSLSWEIIDASLVGVPQARKRFIMVGSQSKSIPSLSSFYNLNKSTEKMTVADYLGKQLGTEFYYAHPRSYLRRAVFSIHEPSSTIRGVNRPMPLNYQFHKADKSFDREKIRQLTTSERARIQTFPPTMKFVESRSQSEQLIGNAVPVNLARFIGRFLQEM